MSGLFDTPIGAVLVSNAVAHGLTRGWLTLAQQSSPEVGGVDQRLLAFLEERLVLAEVPGCGGFDVCAPPLDAPGRRRALARLNVDLALRTSSPRFDGVLIDWAKWPEIGSFHRCGWWSAVAEIHDGLYASLHEPPPAIGWTLSDDVLTAIDVLGYQNRIVSGRLAGVLDELATLTRMADGVLRTCEIFPASFSEQLFARKAELEEVAGRRDAAAHTWRVLSALLPVEQRRVAEQIAASLESLPECP